MDRTTLRRMIVRKGVPARLPRLPRPVEPNALRARYFARLRMLVRDLRELLERELVPALPRLAEAGKQAKGVETHARKTDGLSTAGALIADEVRIDARATIDELLDEVAAELGAKWSRSRFKSLVQPIASDTAKFNAAQTNKVLEPIVGADVVGSELWLAPMLDAFARENVALIKTIPQEAFAKIEKDLTRQIADGERWEVMAEQIQETLGVAESDANRIARDQIGKLNGDLNRVRQTDLGLGSYIWRTVGDNRVRSAHVLRDGRTYSWDAPPGDPSDPGDYGHPGEAIQCRCYPEPDVKALLEDLDL